MDDPVIDRREAVALLFNVSDILKTLERIEVLLAEGDDGEESES